MYISNDVAHNRTGDTSDTIGGRVRNGENRADQVSEVCSYVSAILILTLSRVDCMGYRALSFLYISSY